MDCTCSFLFQASISLLAKAVAHRDSLLEQTGYPGGGTALKLHSLLLHQQLLAWEHECDKITAAAERALAVLERDRRRADGLPDIESTPSIPSAVTLPPPSTAFPVVVIESAPATDVIDLTSSPTLVPSTFPPVFIDLTTPLAQNVLDFDNLIPAQETIDSTIVGTGIDMSIDISMDGMMGDSDLEALLNSFG